MKLRGDRGEDLAVDHLKNKGYGILKRNYKTRFGEIDIIADDCGVTVFVEVKTRSALDFGLPEEAVNRKKQEKIKNTALRYLCTERQDMPSRFDIVSVYLGPEGPEIDHIADAFEIRG